MASRSKATKRLKISELPAHKTPKMRQLKVTAFFKKDINNINTTPRLAITGNSSTLSVESSSNNNKLALNTSLETPEITICDSDDEANQTTVGNLNDTISSNNINNFDQHDDDDDDDDDCQEIFCSDSIIEKRKLEEPKKPKYCDADFVEFETFNYNDETVIDKRTKKERRRCPFYKRIPYTTICVDAFDFAKEDSLQHYFLSHFHADHYIGMTKGFDKPIYCTPITGRLIRYKFKVAPKYIKTFELNEPFMVNNVKCTFYDANHCPGAVIILFELPNLNRYLHTGDFRACSEMEAIPDLKCAPIDCCFLDTTFCDQSKTFPPQSKVLEDAVAVCRYALKKNPRTLIVCGSYCIGKEKVFMAVAEALNLKVWCNKSKRAYFDCLQDENLNAVLVDNQEDAKIHVLPLKMLWKRGMREYLQKHFDHFDAIVALRPSGWEYKRNKHMIPETEGNIAIYPVPYSEHSSYTDLQRFIVWLRPRRIIPTVNMGDPIKRGQMNNIFRKWQRTPYVAESKKELKSIEDFLSASMKELEAVPDSSGHPKLAMDSAKNSDDGDDGLKVFKPTLEATSETKVEPESDTNETIKIKTEGKQEHQDFVKSRPEKFERVKVEGRGVVKMEPTSTTASIKQEHVKLETSFVVKTEVKKE